MSERKSQTICKNEEKTLDCGDSKVLDITEAYCEKVKLFGCGRCLIGCSRENVLDTVQKVCQSRHSCKVSTDIKGFNSGCNGNRYMKVEYICNPEPPVELPQMTTFASTTQSATEPPNTEIVTAASTLIAPSPTIYDTTHASKYNESRPGKSLADIAAAADRATGSGSLNPTIIIVGSTLGGAVLLLLICLAFIFHKRRQNKQSRFSRQAIMEEKPNELYEMDGGYAANERPQAEEKHNELYHIDGGYASGDERQIGQNDDVADDVYTVAAEDQTIPYANATDVTGHATDSGGKMTDVRYSFAKT